MRGLRYKVGVLGQIIAAAVAGVRAESGLSISQRLGRVNGSGVSPAGAGWG